MVPLEREIESLKEKLQGAKVERRALEHRLKVGAQYSVEFALYCVSD